MKTILIWLLLGFSSLCFAQAPAAVVVPGNSGIGYTHLQYNPPAVPGHTHMGVDIMASCGKPMYPLMAGYVVKVANNSNGLGFAIMIRHPGKGHDGNDLYTIYLHMEASPNRNGVVLRVGDYVYRSMPIGNIGATGFADGCHTHFEIRNFYNPNAAGEGWYHEQAKSCSTGSLNIYACGDQRNTDWALRDWEDPLTFQVPECNPSREMCTLASAGSVGWFPPVSDCRNANQWFIMGTNSEGKPYSMGSRPDSSACPPIACTPN